ncbi:MAG: bifunctional DNA primase/polymerase, partial [Patescibacteria group bacterium]|nr:bifunctional DNA primase/polymerase [Patescibacteria group bacterium]
MNPADVLQARDMATFFRSRGMQALPSSPTDKRPLCRYADLWEAWSSEDLFTRWPTTNIQVMTGRFWRLLVIDLDGPEASEKWETMGRTPRTWVTHSGGGGRHLWFRLPANYPHPLPKAILWKGDGPHEAIERLCDQSLVMAPPSIHPKTGERYRFADKAHSPFSLPMPADCPEWVLRLKPLAPERCVTDRANTIAVVTHGAIRSPATPRASAPLSTDPITLARTWGVRFTGKVSPKGWAECHAIDREDAKPSAAVHRESGVYVDRGSGTKLSLAKLGIAMNQFSDIRDALSQLGV